MRLPDPRREAAAWALARSTNQSAAAREAGVDRSTLGRWIKEPSFSSRVDELRIQRETPSDDDDLAAEAEQGLARLIPIAIEVVEASLKGEPYNGKPVTAQQHANALKTIDLARKLEPKAASSSGAPSLGDLIAQAESRGAGSS
jgi:transposase-like protein